MIHLFQIGQGVLTMIFTTGQPSVSSTSRQSLRDEFALRPTSFSGHRLKNSLKSAGFNPSTLFASEMLTSLSPSQVYLTTTFPFSFSIITGYYSALEKYSLAFKIRSSPIWSRNVFGRFSCSSIYSS